MKYPLPEDQFHCENDDNSGNYFSISSIANKPNALKLLEQLRQYPKEMQIQIVKNLLKASAKKLNRNEGALPSKHDLGPDGRILYDLVRDYNRSYYQALKTEGTLLTSLKEAEDYYLQEKAQLSHRDITILRQEKSFGQESQHFLV